MCCSPHERRCFHKLMRAPHFSRTHRRILLVQRHSIVCNELSAAPISKRATRRGRSRAVAALTPTVAAEVPLMEPKFIMSGRKRQRLSKADNAKTGETALGPPAIIQIPNELDSHIERGLLPK